MLKALDVAEYILSLASEEEGELISNLKLQKLIYYAQGFSLALHNKSLFSEEIQAWEHGPVVPAVYHYYKIFGHGALPKPKKLDLNKFDQKTKDLLNEVYAVYGQYSASALRDLTHTEPPWKNTPKGKVISLASMKEFFKTQLM